MKNNVNLVGNLQSYNPDTRELLLKVTTNELESQMTVKLLNACAFPYALTQEGEKVRITGHVGNNGRIIGRNIQPMWSNFDDCNEVEVEGTVIKENDKYYIFTSTPRGKTVKSQLEFSGEAPVESIYNLYGTYNQGVMHVNIVANPCWYDTTEYDDDDNNENYED